MSWTWWQYAFVAVIWFAVIWIYDSVRFWIWNTRTMLETISEQLDHLSADLTEVRRAVTNRDSN